MLSALSLKGGHGDSIYNIYNIYVPVFIVHVEAGHALWGQLGHVRHAVHHAGGLQQARHHHGGLGHGAANCWVSVSVGAVVLCQVNNVTRW